MILEHHQHHPLQRLLALVINSNYVNSFVAHNTIDNYSVLNIVFIFPFQWN